MKAKGLGLLCGAAALTIVVGRAEAQLAPPAQEQPAPSSELRTGPATVAPHWSKNKYPDSIPEGATYYIVVRGDTLWDISKRFLGNAYLWPQVWDHNRYITDAHWIYPGDPVILPKVALIAEGAGAAGELPGEAGEEEGLPGEVGLGVGPSALFPITEEVTMQCAQSIVPDREDESLYVVGSEQGAGKVSLAERDILYLNKGSNAGVRAGDVFTLNHFAYDVRHPLSGRKVGHKVEVTGWGRVILVEENTATIVVEQACNDIHAGDYLKPFERVSVPLALRRPPADRLTPPTGKAQGHIVDISDDAAIAGTGHILSIDLGSEDGVAPGNMLTVYRIMYPSVPTARNVLGELAVLAVRDRTATAKVMFSNDAMTPGDQVELK